MRAARAKATAALAAAALLHAGCSLSTYTPRPSPRIARIDGNERHFVRDGQRFEIGIGGDRVGLVQGNERAEALARRSRVQEIIGFVLYGYAVGGTVAGASLLTRGTSAQEGLGTGLVASGLGSLFVSLPFLFFARANFVDAVNVYNDGVDDPGLSARQ